MTPPFFHISCKLHISYGRFRRYRICLRKRWKISQKFEKRKNRRQHEITVSLFQSYANILEKKNFLQPETKATSRYKEFMERSWIRKYFNDRETRSRWKFARSNFLQNTHDPNFKSTYPLQPVAPLPHSVPPL